MSQRQAIRPTVLLCLGAMLWEGVSTYLEPVRRGSAALKSWKFEGNTYSYTYSYTRISQILEMKRRREICVYEYVYEYG
jgi:hypothetical protein